MSVGNPDAAIRADAKAGRNGFGSGNFFGDKRVGVNARETAGITKHPYGAIRSENHFAGQRAVEAIFRFPDVPARRLRIPHSHAAVGAEPETLALVAQFGPDHVVRETFGLRPAGPGFAANPALDSRAAESNPIGALAVFGDGKRSVH